MELTHEEVKMVESNLRRWTASDASCLAPLTSEEQAYINGVAMENSTFLPETESDYIENQGPSNGFTLERLQKWILEERKAAINNSSKVRQYVNFASQFEQKTGALNAMMEQLSKDMDSLNLSVGQTMSQIETFLLTGEQIMTQQSRLKRQITEVQQVLSYFYDISSLSRKLNSNLLRTNQEMMMPILRRVDEISTFFKTHQNFKEVDAYEENLQLVAQKALSLMEEFIDQLVDLSCEHVRDKATKTESSGEDAFQLFYGEFRIYATKIRALSDELDRRACNIEGCDEVLIHCQQHYFEQRNALIASSVNETLKGLDESHQTDMCALVKASCSFMVKLCIDEVKIYEEFFPFVDLSSIHEFLSVYCYQFQQMLRPKIIHMLHIETLTEVINILNSDVISAYTADDIGPFLLTIIQTLEDVQERLAYRATVYMKDEIRNYQPVAGDLAFPDRLKMMREIALQHKPETINLHGRHLASAVPEDLHGLWYPTLRRTLLCLAKLFRSLDNKVFQALSQEILMDCMFSLCMASDTISAHKSPMDGQLFLIQHLLLLREQIMPFNVDFALKEAALDFNKLKDAVVDFIKRKSDAFSIHNNSFLALLLSGQHIFQESFIDSRREVDRLIKQSCETFIDETSHVICGPLDEKNISAEERHHKFLESLKKHIPVIRNAISLYLNNYELEEALFHHVKSSILGRFDDSCKRSTEENVNVYEERVASLRQEVEQILSSQSEPVEDGSASEQ